MSAAAALGGNVEHEVKLLIEEVKRLGKQDANGKYSVKFGVIVKGDLAFRACVFTMSLEPAPEAVLLFQYISWNDRSYLYAFGFGPTICVLLLSASNECDPHTHASLHADDRCANIFEALVGTLKAAKKRGVVSYNSELLLQGVHDNVDIILQKEAL